MKSTTERHVHNMPNLNISPAKYIYIKQKQNSLTIFLFWFCYVQHKIQFRLSYFVIFYAFF